VLAQDALVTRAQLADGGLTGGVDAVGDDLDPDRAGVEGMAQQQALAGRVDRTAPRLGPVEGRADLAAAVFGLDLIEAGRADEGAVRQASGARPRRRGFPVAMAFIAEAHQPSKCGP
jgi:hypothetical protein